MNRASWNILSLQASVPISVSEDDGHKPTHSFRYPPPPAPPEPSKLKSLSRAPFLIHPNCWGFPRHPLHPVLSTNPQRFLLLLSFFSFPSPPLAFFTHLLFLEKKINNNYWPWSPWRRRFRLLHSPPFFSRQAAGSAPQLHFPPSAASLTSPHPYPSADAVPRPELLPRSRLVARDINCISPSLLHRVWQVTNDLRSLNVFFPGSLSSWLLRGIWRWHHSLLTDSFSSFSCQDFMLCWISHSSKTSGNFCLFFFCLFLSISYMPSALLLERWPIDLAFSSQSSLHQNASIRYWSLARSCLIEHSEMMEIVPYLHCLMW